MVGKDVKIIVLKKLRTGDTVPATSMRPPHQPGGDATPETKRIRP